MKTIILALAALIAVPATARAGASVDIHFNLPVLLPPPVVVSTGVTVVPDVDEEVFVVSGMYYVRRDHVWYRSRDHRHGWVVVPARAVPARLVRIPPGQYRRYKPMPPGHMKDHGGHGHGHDRGGGHGRGHGRG